MNTKCNPKPHKQVLAKVNAYVDEDIRELVEVLNRLDKVWTFQSCQEWTNNRGFVMLNYGDEDTSQDEIIEFGKKFVALIRENIQKSEETLPPICETLTQLEWTSNSPQPYLHISFSADAIKEITNVLQHVVQDFHYSKAGK